MKSSLLQYLPAFVLAFSALFFGYDVLTDILYGSDGMMHTVVELVVFSATTFVLFRELKHVKTLQQSIAVEQSKNARLAGEMFKVMQQQFGHWQLTPAETEVALLLIKGLLYTNPNFGKQYLSAPRLTKYPLWIADYESKTPPLPTPWKTTGWTLFQYSQSGKVKGVNGNVELDKFDGNLKQFERFIQQSNH